jgi:hypothetical protein
MKSLLIASVVAIVVVGGVGIYSLRVLGGFQQRVKEIEAVFELRAKDLRETDEMFPYVPVPHLDPVRFGTWLEARTEIARALGERAAEPASGDFHRREATNVMLVVVREELIEREMSLAEYRAISARWRALLGLPEFEGLRKGWRQKTAVGDHAEGLPLPPPAADAQEKELEQLRRYARQLEESMDADLLGPSLDKAASGGGAGDRG